MVFAACKKEKQSVETSRVTYLPYFKDASFKPYWFTPGSEELKNFHKISDFSLTNQLGEEVSSKTFENKIYITDFFFASCPGICPKMTSSMFQIQEIFKDDSEISFLSHSVTPTKDSVSVLNAYAKEHGVLAHKWHLVTGNRKEIYDLGRKVYFVENDLGAVKTEDDFLHTENFLLIDKNKYIRGIYNSLNRASMAQLIIDIKALKLEK